MMTAISPTNMGEVRCIRELRIVVVDVKDVLVKQDLVKELSGKQPEGMNVTYWKDSETKVALTIRICLAAR